MNQFLTRLDLALSRVGYTYGTLAYNLSLAKLPPGVSFEQFLDDVVGKFPLADSDE
jgi:hypothetical protein